MQHASFHACNVMHMYHACKWHAHVSCLQCCAHVPYLQMACPYIMPAMPCTCIMPTMPCTCIMPANGMPMYHACNAVHMYHACNAMHMYHACNAVTMYYACKWHAHVLCLQCHAHLMPYWTPHMHTCMTQMRWPHIPINLDITISLSHANLQSLYSLCYSLPSLSSDKQFIVPGQARDKGPQSDWHYLILPKHIKITQFPVTESSRTFQELFVCRHRSSKAAEITRTVYHLRGGEGGGGGEGKFMARLAYWESRHGM